MANSVSLDKRRKLIDDIIINNPTQIKDFVFLDEKKEINVIGEGGSGIVLRFSQIFTKNAKVDRAIKFFIFSDELHKKLNRLISKNNFETEIVSLTKLNHQNVIKIIDGGIISYNSSHIPFVVTDLVKGPTLADLIFEKDSSKKTIIDSTGNEVFMKNDEMFKKLFKHEDDVFNLFNQILEGLIYLHKNNFYHCDIAPKNIFIQNEKDSFFAIIGDLGCGKFPIDNKRKINVIGTKWYMPKNAQAHKDKKVNYKTFINLQPQWDIYSVVKTFQKVTEFILNKNVFEENDALTKFQRKINEIILNIDTNKNTPKEYSVEYIKNNIKIFSPSSKKIADIDGISDAVKGKNILQPLNTVFLPKRFNILSKHEAMCRLVDVPQVFCDLISFPGANHNRYEHSLGTFQLMRKAIVALFRNPKYSEKFDNRNIIGGLVSAILSSIAHHPFSFVINELLVQDDIFFQKHSRFSESKLFDTIITKNYGSDYSITELISDKFKEIKISDINYILYGSDNNIRDKVLDISKYLLNSSLGVKTIDFIIRDSLHIGFSYKIDEESIYDHFFIKDDSFYLNQTGVPIAEKIITNKYWMFKGIYWNRPNRANLAMLKYIFYNIFNDSNKNIYIEEYYNNIYNLTSKEVLSIFKKGNNEDELDESIKLVERKQIKFHNILYFGENSSYENINKVYIKFRDSKYNEQLRLRKKIEDYLVEEGYANKTNCGAVLVLLDIPSSKSVSKMGEDVNVAKYEGTTAELNRTSEVIKAIYNSFNDQINLVRIFIRYDVFKKIKEINKNEKEIGKEIYTIIKNFFNL